MNSLLKISIEIGTSKILIDLAIKEIAILVLLITILLIISYNLKKNGVVFKDVIPVSMKYSVGGQEVSYNIVANYRNIEIAHSVYTEIMTRKAGQPFDEEHDVITEVYDSWYQLFCIIREETKNIPGSLLRNNNRTKDLVRLLMDILNQGLRPHLTEFHAEYRAWYNDQSITGKRVKDVQSLYPRYSELVSSIRDVNTTLRQYAEQLEGLIYHSAR